MTVVWTNTGKYANVKIAWHYFHFIFVAAATNENIVIGFPESVLLLYVLCQMRTHHSDVTQKHRTLRIDT